MIAIDCPDGAIKNKFYANEYKFKHFKHISDIPRQQWDEIASAHTATRTTNFLETIEVLNSESRSTGYVVIYNINDQIVGTTHYKITNEDAALFSHRWIKSLIRKLRKPFPNFLRIKTLECAPPIYSSSYTKTANPTIDSKLIQSLGNFLIGIATQKRVNIIIFGPFDAQENTYELDLYNMDFNAVPCLPVASIDILWNKPDAYLSALKSYYRSKLLKHLRINQTNQIRHELRDTFDDLADVLWKQWHVVNQHATECDDEKLTPDFYNEFSSRLDNSKVLLFYASNELIGHALLLIDRDTLIWRNFGRSKSENDSLYIYACHKVIETAINLGLKHVDMGVTTYEIKRDFGASITPRNIAIRLSSKFLNSHAAKLYLLLNKVPKLHGKDVFKVRPTLLL